MRGLCHPTSSEALPSDHAPATHPTPTLEINMCRAREQVCCAGTRTGGPPRSAWEGDPSRALVSAKALHARPQSSRAGQAAPLWSLWW